MAATCASITSADFANDGWFSEPSVTDIHPALRPQSPLESLGSKFEDPGGMTAGDMLDELNFESLNLEGGGDKIALPVDFEGRGLIPVMEGSQMKLDYKSQQRFVNPRPASSRSHKPATRYVLFPAPPKDKPRADSQVPKRNVSSSTSGSSSMSTYSQHIQNQNRETMHFNPDAPYSLPSDTTFQIRPDNVPGLRHTRQNSSSPSTQSIITPRSGATSPQFDYFNSPTSESHSRSRTFSSNETSALPALSRWSTSSSTMDHSHSSPRSFKFPKSNVKSKHTSYQKPKSAPFTSSLKTFLRASSPLIDAAKQGDYHELLHLLAPGAQNYSIDASDKDGLTALHHACKQGYENIADVLIQRHANLESETKHHYRTALYLASQSGAADIVSNLLSHNASVNSAGKMDGATALHKASQLGHELVVQRLINAGANVNIRDVEGMTPLIWATQGKQPETARLLIISGADIESRIRSGANQVEASSKEGITVLQKAVNSNDHPFARLFLEMGANPNAPAPHGMRPVHKAASRGDARMLALLIEFGAEVNSRTIEGWTPLHCAARYGHRYVCEVLLREGALGDCRDNMGRTARDVGDRNGFADVF